MLSHLKNNLVKIFVTVGGLGYAPVAPGTVGSLPAVFLVWYFPNQALPIFIVLLTVSLLCCASAEILFAKKDPSFFVMDEVCGMMVTLFNMPHDYRWFIAGFIVFRILDSMKPWPIILFQRLKHPQAIVWDDVAAGVAANFILTGARYFI